LLIIACGQPARMPWLCPISATVGFALFFSFFSSETSKKRIFWISTAWFMAVQLIQLSWMTSIEYQGYYILIVYLFLSFALGLQFGLLAAFVGSMKRPLHVVALAALWTLIEWSRVHIACGFSWNPVGLALSFHPIPLQSASLFGIFGLTFLVMLTNLWALYSWRYSTKRYRDFCLWGGVAALPYIFGALHLYYHSARMDRSEQIISAALVQTGLLPSEKVQQSDRRAHYVPLERQWESIAIYLKEMKELDLIVLPEATVPMQSDRRVIPLSNMHAILTKHYGFEKQLPAEGKNVSNLFWAKALTHVHNCDVVIGLDHYDPQADRFYNSAFLIPWQQDTVQRYDKRILLPLAEYLPFTWLHPLTKSYGIYDFFSKGESMDDLKGRLNLSVSICYEETFSEAIRKQVKKESDLLINLTNDAYYPHSMLAEQHFTHARLRTVENGRALLRSCNTGVTAAVDSLGRIVDRFSQKEDEFRRGALHCKVPLYKYQTLYSLWGDGGIVGMSLAILSLFFIHFLNSTLPLWRSRSGR
jgi:apolipoprotein N-acyltransferase